jgi:hypothetical protein
MVEGGGGAGFLGEAAPALLIAGQRSGRKHLDGHEPAQSEIPGLVNDAHAAFAELGEHGVVAERSAHEFTGSHGPSGETHARDSLRPTCRRRNADAWLLGLT